MNIEKKQQVQQRYQEKKLRTPNSRIFTLQKGNQILPKYHYSEEGEIINPEFNNRTFAKKAYKAYLKGQQNFRYKDNLYVVPALSNLEMMNYLDSINKETKEEE